MTVPIVFGGEKRYTSVSKLIDRAKFEEGK